MSMDPWGQIQDLFHAALEREPGQRAAFLSLSCPNNPELRREVESLLAHEGEADGLLESPAWKDIPPGETTSEPQAMAAGSTLGVFRIVELLGVGGMGEVYRAADTRLHRDVAIKVLPAEYANQPEWLSRFHREARALAALNHPCIAAIYGLEESGGICALAMELVEGATLAARIARGQISLETSLGIARQIAEALEYAHEKGIIHRDLKPANVKITREGAVKVLDFGLAKATQQSAAAGDSNERATLTSQAGTILGTPAYMPPEQAKGEPVDRRADIWAFGVVLFEMLSGRRLYPQGSTTETLAAVIRDGPQWAELPSNTPPAIRKLLGRCLEKDAKRRLRDIGEARIAIEDCLGGRVEFAGWEGAPKRRLYGVAMAAVVAAVGVAAMELMRLRSAALPLPAQAVRYRIALPEGMKLTPSESFALSPDGRTLAYWASDTDRTLRLWVQPLDALEPKLLPGTETRGGGPPPIWSPDSKFLAFDAGGKLKTVDLAGSAPVTVCPTPGIVLGGAWSRQGVIIFGNEKGGLMSVPSKGGNAVALTTLDPTRGDLNHGWATILPDGRHFLYSRFSSVRENNGVYVGSLDRGPGEQGLKRVAVTQYTTQFVPLPNGNGRLLFMRDDTIWAQDLNTSRFELTGEPVRVAESVGFFLGRSLFSASQGSVMAYRNPRRQLFQLAWFDRHGTRQAPVGEPMHLGSSSPVVSPDGTRVALPLFEGSRMNLWMYDLVRDVRKRMTVDAGTERSVLWSPDGKRLVFSSSRGGHFDLYQMAAGGGTAELLYISDDDKDATSWSPDGKFLAYQTAGGATSWDVWVLPLQETGTRTAVPLLQTAAFETSGAFSPAGRWIAYDSDFSGTREVYVQEFAPAVRGYLAGPRILVSRGGGFNPHWRSDGKELFYVASDSTVMAVAVSAGTTFQPGVPERLFRYAAERNSRRAWWGEPEGNGKRFLFAVPVEDAASAPFTVLLNWQTELNK